MAGPEGEKKKRRLPLISSCFHPYSKKYIITATTLHAITAVPEAVIFYENIIISEGEGVSCPALEISLHAVLLGDLPPQ